jgi:hypothetical protein
MKCGADQKSLARQVIDGVGGALHLVDGMPDLKQLNEDSSGDDE